MYLNKKMTKALEALEHSIKNVPQDWNELCQNEEVMEQVMEMAYDLKPLSKQIGVSKNLLPAVVELEDDEIKQLVDKIRETWAAYHYFAEFPEGLNVRVAYECLLSLWDETVACCPEGNLHFDFSIMEQFDDLDDPSQD